MKNSIICKTTAKGKQSLYLKVNGKEYFLFSQSFRKSVRDYYRNAVTIDRALDYSASTSLAVSKAMEKLRVYIPYVEKEYGVRVLNKTLKTRHSNKTRRETSVYDELMAA